MNTPEAPAAVVHRVSDRDPRVHPMTATALEKLNETRRYWPHVQRKAGVSRSWITQFVAGKLKNPRVDRLQAIINACEDVLKAMSMLQSDLKQK